MKRVALMLWAATIAAVAAGLLLPIAAHGAAGLDGYPEWRSVVLVGVADTSLGAVIVRHRPRHPIGWILLGSGALSALQLVSGEYAGLGAGIAAGAPVAAWVAMQAQFLSVMFTVFVFQLFPTGRPLSPRWRWLPRATAAGVLLNLTAAGLTPGPLGTAPQYANPFGVAGAAALLQAFEVAGVCIIMGGIAGGLATLALRLRRGDGVERQQIKVLWYAASVSVAVLVSANVFFGEQMEQAILGDIVWGGAALSLSTAIALALLRYRLYDIDRVISRTVTYALVSVVLVLIYGALAVIPSTVLRLESDLLVAAATLTAAAVFVPLRRRLQQAVDRRFNRARYDARRVVERFAGRLRDDIDLDDLAGDLRLAVTGTVQPAHLSLWLRPTDTDR